MHYRTSFVGAAARRLSLIGLLAAIVTFLASVSSAQEGGNPALANKQRDVADRFKALEKLLLRSSEIGAAENPTRSALLQQAAKLGKQKQLADLLAKAASSLNENQLSEALNQQKISRENLQTLLELLQSENREKRIRDERDQVRRWIEETNRLLRMQGSLRGRTEGGQKTEEAARDQERLLDKAKDISKSLDPDAESQSSSQKPDSSGKSSDGASEEPKNAEIGKESEKSEQEAKQAESDQDDESTKESNKDSKEASDGQGRESSQQSPSSEPKAGEPKEGQAQSDQGEPTEGKNSEQAQPKPKQPNSEQDSQSPQSQGSQSESQSQSQQSGGEPQEPQKQQPQAPATPAQKAAERYERAKQRMEEAQKDLENSDRDEAVKKQQEAEDELRAAIEELEQILRQLREEEVERSLASLEDRLRRMLDMQNKVLDESQRLYEIAGGESGNRQVEIRASKLAGEEKKILTEGERAYLLLREEGSSVAFPEAMEQVNADLGKTVQRLADGKIDDLTLLIETEIVASLEEMVNALVQVQKENEEKKRQQQQQPGQSQPSQQGDQPLVNQLAELRLILTLQKRINKRTDAMSKLLENPSDEVGQADGTEILSELKGLSNRQSNIYRVTRDIQNNAAQQ